MVVLHIDVRYSLTPTCKTTPQGGKELLHDLLPRQHHCRREVCNTWFSCYLVVDQTLGTLQVLVHIVTINRIEWNRENLSDLYTMFHLLDMQASSLKLSCILVTVETYGRSQMIGCDINCGTHHVKWTRLSEQIISYCNWRTCEGLEMRLGPGCVLSTICCHMRQ